MTLAVATDPAASCPVALPDRSQYALRRHVQRHGAALLNQQCWLWGCDVRRESGNALLQRGFRRMRPPCGSDRSTQYTLAEERFVVRLWGSGIYAGTERDGLFLNRFLFEPRCARHQHDTWQDPALLRTGPRYWDQPLLAQLCAWVAAYESWIAEIYGTSYRRGCLSCFKESISNAEEIAAAWQQLATLLHAPGDGRALRTGAAYALTTPPARQQSAAKV